MLLLIDAGNSFVKVAFADARGVGGVTRVARERWSEYLAGLGRPGPTAVVVANVAGVSFASQLDAKLKAWRCPALWVTAREQGYGVYNRYRDPAQLGADRWCALVAAHRRVAGGKLVVCAGTAVTIDALAGDGVFHGGLILPGPALMRAGLAAGTAGVAVAEGAFETFPRDTANGVQTGALLAIAGAVERMAEAFETVAGPASLLLTGGRGEALVPVLRRPVTLVADLVIEGLFHIAREEGLA
jgi:type III pantothenate kinase